MALFKTRKPGKPGAEAGTAPPAQSIDLMRRRAKHRLIGAAVLVLLGVVGFPLLFDSQPRPVAVDIPIEIPDKAKVKPLVLGPVPSAEPVASVPVAPEPVRVAASATPIAPAAKPATSVAAAPTEPAKTTVASVLERPAAQADDGSKARALLDGQAASAASAPAGRFVVQVGAFSDAAKLHEVRQKLEKAGLKTYTQVVETKDGKRTRVRVGPFATQADADKAATRIKALTLSAAVLKM